MRITFVTPFPTLSGGIRVVATYAAELQARGHEVTVVSAPDRGRRPLKSRLKVFLGLKRLRPLRKRTTLIDVLGARYIEASVTPITEREVPEGDAVIATWWETAEWVAALPPDAGRKFYLLQDYEAGVVHLAERAAATYNLPLRKIAVSSYIRQEVLNNHPVHGDIAVVSNAVDTDQFDAPPRGRNPTLTVGFLYSSAPRKNAGLAMDSLALVRAEQPGLVVRSFGRHRDPSDLPDWVEYRYAPPQDEIPGIYASCDLWLFPTKREGFGLPLLEAMACRTPILATAAGAAPDLVDGRNGLILPPTPNAFAEAILRFRDMPEADWKSFSDAAYRTASTNRWSDATDRLLAVLEKEMSRTCRKAG